MYCSLCGSALIGDARFCTRCGRDEYGTLWLVSARSQEASGEPAPGRPAYMRDLPDSVRLTSAWGRLGGNLLEGLLMVVTLFVGWFVWSIILWGRGQTPAKQLLGKRVLRRNSPTPAGRGRMVVREVLCKGLIGVLSNLTLVGFVVYFWLLWDSDRQELWDKMVGTVVVNDPENALDPRRSWSTCGTGERGVNRLTLAAVLLKSRCARRHRVPAPGPHDPDRVDRARRRLPARGPDLAPPGCRARPRPGDPRVPALPPERRHGRARLAPLPYLAGHGYACIRVDQRGTGESDGILEDEYPPQEQSDASR